MVEKGNFFTLECQLIGVEGIRELESHHWVVIITLAGKKEQQILKLLGESLMKNQDIYSLKVLPHKICYQFQRENANYAVEKHSRRLLNQRIKGHQ